MYTSPVEGLHMSTQRLRIIYAHLCRQYTPVYAISRLYNHLVLDHMFKIQCVDASKNAVVEHKVALVRIQPTSVTVTVT